MGSDASGNRERKRTMTNAVTHHTEMARYELEVDGRVGSYAEYERRNGTVGLHPHGHVAPTAAARVWRRSSSATRSTMPAGNGSRSCRSAGTSPSSSTPHPEYARPSRRCLRLTHSRRPLASLRPWSKFREAWIIDAVRSPRGKGKENGVAAPGAPAADPGPGAQRAAATATASTPPTSTTSSWAAAPAAATTRWTSPAWPRSTPAGRSTRPASPSTASAARASRPSTSPPWACSSGFQDLVVGGGVESMSRPGADARRRLHRQQPRTCATSTTWWPRASPPT